MNFTIQSSNPDIRQRLEFLFFLQIEEDIRMIFEHPDEYVIEYDKDGGVLGLVLRTTTNPIEEWKIFNTKTTNRYQCLNRIGMIHLMCFFDAPADFSNFHITFDDDVRCECGAAAVNTTHSLWCPKYE